ncbi:hypothetical protein KCU81_g9091, partial [Aureobasidium melanogenum]
MAANYIASAEQTMILVRRIAAHLAVEPNLPAPEDLTRGEVDAWIRALNTGIHSRVIDLLALPVLECLLYMRGRNLGSKTKHLRRAPSERFRPVVVNPWVREDVTLNREHLPWIPGDRLVETFESNDNVEDVVETEGQVAIVHQGDDMEEDSTIPEGQGTQLENPQLAVSQLDDTQPDDTQQNADEDDSADGDTQLANTQLNDTEQQIQDDSALSALPSIEQTVAEEDPALQNTEQSVIETDPDPLHETKGVKSNYNTRSKAVPNADVPMEDAPEQYDPSREYPGRIYCICNDTVGGTMVLCENHRDNDCKGKWFHLRCAGLHRSPAKNVRWYCMDCRKKLGRGLLHNGVVR